jgi:hypothetical protein
VYPDHWRRRLLTAQALFDLNAPRERRGYRKVLCQDGHPLMLGLNFEARIELAFRRRQMRQPDYPAGDHDLLDRFTVDALKAGHRLLTAIAWSIDMRWRRVCR